MSDLLHAIWILILFEIIIACLVGWWLKRKGEQDG